MEFVEVADDVSRDDVLAAQPVAREARRRRSRSSRTRSPTATGTTRPGSSKLAGAQRISERTLRRAALEELEVEHERRGFPSTTWWRLPQSCQPLPPRLGMTGRGRMDTGVAAPAESSRANDSGGRHDCAHPRLWLARDGVWRCRECEPPAFPGEVLEERTA